MPGFRLKINGLKNIEYGDSLQRSLPADTSFRTEFFLNGDWNPMVAEPMLVGNIIVFLVRLFENDESMALVYNEKDCWSDIEKESTRLTEAVGAAIESYYSSGYWFLPDHRSKEEADDQRGNPLLN